MLTIFVVFALVFSVFSKEDSKTTIPSSTTRRIKTLDGWEFLQPHEQVDMERRNFNFSGNASVVCFSGITTESEHAKHAITQNLRFKNNVTAQWHNFTQTYTFYNDSLGYNIMNSTSGSVYPSVSLKFLVIGYKCAVVKVNFAHDFDSGMPEDKGKSSNMTQKHPTCAILVKHREISEGHPYCLREFARLCITEKVYHVYDEKECNKTARKTPHC
uniref:Lipocalin n=1 Tax=Rhipicephalus appendiculatus TaxID=34631 RepID=A0A131Z320_RHIAP